MRRKTAIATAGTVVAVLLAGSVATAANLGILSSTSESDVGDLPATTSPAPIETVIVEEPVPVPASDPAATGAEEGYGDFGSPVPSADDDEAEHDDHDDRGDRDDHGDQDDHEDHEGDQDDD
ncbi:MAG: hypothetical protein IT198_17780 [Acidimicrobiia bacterium]|nr:hypothetical protein [Acidimicrobiia bacterium]